MSKHVEIFDRLFGLVDHEGYLNNLGTDLLVGLLARIKPEQWGAAFIPLKKMGVHAAVELAIIDKDKVFMTWREDEHFKGWHLPGTYLQQGEVLAEAVYRCAMREINVSVEAIRQLSTFNNTDNQRFHDVTILLHCALTHAYPDKGQWFAEKPIELIYPQRKYWPYIYRALMPPAKSRLEIGMPWY